jgi:hypothetical protein
MATTMKKKYGTLRKGKNAPESESDSEEKPSIFTRQDFVNVLKKTSRQVP